MKKEETNPYRRNVIAAIPNHGAFTDTVCDKIRVAAQLPESVTGTDEHYRKTLAALNWAWKKGFVTKVRKWTGKRWGVFWKGRK